MTVTDLIVKAHVEVMKVSMNAVSAMDLELSLLTVIVKEMLMAVTTCADLD